MKSSPRCSVVGAARAVLAKHIIDVAKQGELDQRRLDVASVGLTVWDVEHGMVRGCRHVAPSDDDITGRICFHQAWSGSERLIPVGVFECLLRILSSEHEGNSMLHPHLYTPFAFAISFYCGRVESWRGVPRDNQDERPATIKMSPTARSRRADRRARRDSVGTWPWKLAQRRSHCFLSR